VVEPAAIEVGSVGSFKPGTVVSEVDTVAIVAAPGRVVIVGIPGELRFTNLGGGIVATAVDRGRLIVHRLVVHRCGLLIDGSRSGVDGCRSHIYPGAGDTKTNVCVDIYL
jgi:hypothetical protein